MWQNCFSLALSLFKMPILYYRILFFCLIPIGIVTLVFGIRLLRKSFNGTVLLESAFDKPTACFSVTKSGVHSVWMKGPLFRRTPINKLHPQIFNEATKEEISLNTSLLSPRSNGFSTGRMELYTFSAEAGSYRLEITEGSGISGVQQWLASAFPARNVDLKKYFIQIRESQSPLYTLLAIPVILAGGFGIIGGFVLGLLANQIIPHDNKGFTTAAIQKIEVVTVGGDRGYSATCTFTKDSVFHRLRIFTDSTANMSIAQPAGEGEWKMLLQNIDLAEFRNAQNGESAQPVDGTDTEITITTADETVSKSNAGGSATWNSIAIWSQKRCMK